VLPGPYLSDDHSASPFPPSRTAVFSPSRFPQIADRISEFGPYRRPPPQHHVPLFIEAPLLFWSTRSSLPFHLRFHPQLILLPIHSSPFFLKQNQGSLEGKIHSLMLLTVLPSFRWVWFGFLFILFDPFVLSKSVTDCSSFSRRAFNSFIFWAKVTTDSPSSGFVSLP